MIYIYVTLLNFKDKYLASYLLIVFLQFPIYSNAQSSQLIGHFPVYNFSAKQYGAFDQNWVARQDERGLMYFGNNQGLLIYDGEEWKIIEVDNQSLVYSMDIDKNGKVYIGGENEFGVIKYDSVGSAYYHSLSGLLPEGLKDYGQVWETFATDSGIYFQTNNHLFIYKNDELNINSSSYEIHKSFFIGQNLFLRQDGLGLSIFMKDQLNLIPNGDIFKSTSIFGMLEINPGRILIFTEADGIYEMLYSPTLEDIEIRKTETPIDNILDQVFLYNAIRLNENMISLGTWGNGVILTDTSLQLISIADKLSGLQDDIIQNQFVDKTGNLWLCLSSGISRLEISSYYSVINDKEGLTGTPQDCARFNNFLYVATNAGLYHEIWSEDQNLSDYKTVKFNRFSNIDVECWDLLTFSNKGEELLLLITNDKVLEIDKRNQVRTLLEDIPYKLYQSKLDPSRVYIGLEKGLCSIYRSNRKWIKEGKVYGITEKIQDISEDHLGNLWMGTEDEGVIKMNITSIKDNRLSNYKHTRYDTTSGLAGGPYIVSQITGPPVVATENGIYRLIQLENKFIPDSTYGVQFANGSRYIHRMSEYFNPDIWLFTMELNRKSKFELGYLKKQEQHYEWIYKPFNKISDNTIHVIFPDENQKVWFGGSEGLFLYDNREREMTASSYPCLITMITYVDGGVEFGGNYTDLNGNILEDQPDHSKHEISNDRNSLSFFFAAYSGNDEAFQKYSYYLEGYDKNWSDWLAETKKEYTNLPKGEYIFQVKSMDVYENESSIASYAFTILAPWYLKWWAFVAYFLIATALIYTIVILYTRQLRQIIKDRTAEVVKKNEIITLKNRDIMDSIQYAKRIQSALLPAEDAILSKGLDGFILFLPRDIVSGDFYWISHRNELTITMVADCTGHGVPGAFLSMLGVAFLENIMRENTDFNAAQILDKLREHVIVALKQKGHEGEQKDGMDVALHIINWKDKIINFAGANNSLVLIRDNELQTIKADRMPIGIHERASVPFTNHIFEAQKGDVLYSFSDGFQDQFGGQNNKKFMLKRLKDLLLEIHQSPMQDQKEKLRKTFEDWMEPCHCEQVDDILIIGVRI
ncbi:MAG: SpoIIE family protein phosphatase [Bacteroidales bacterium]|nr:SpoIIE family protein phosphatase [Bacteroidales bacterium]MCF8391108.1 SpoIIE family protein phosphatase [Bacteroidales bacterium]